MTRRTLKKRCKRAVEVLIAEHGYRPDVFSPSDGTETVDAPLDMEPRFVRNGFMEPGLLKGTPLHHYRSSYEYDERSVKLPSEMLLEVIQMPFMAAWYAREMSA